MKSQELKNSIIWMSILLISIMTSGYTLSLLNTGIFYGLLVIPTCYFAILGKHQWGHSSFISCGMSFFSILSFIINFNSQFILYNLRYILTFTFAYFVSINIKFRVFSHWYVDIISFLSIISLIFHLSVNVFGIVPQLPIIQTPQNVSYYNGIFFFINAQGFLQFRNYGAFWEPGIFASHILFAMSLEIILRKQPRFSIIVILIGTLYTTKSTAGYILFLLVIILLIAKRAKTKSQILIILFGSVIIIIIFLIQREIISFLVKINPSIFSELIYENQSPSLVHRLDSPIQNFLVFLKKPFLGASLGGADVLYSYLGNVSQTSTTTYLFAANGIGGIFYSLLLIRGTLLNKKFLVLNRFILFALLFLIVNKEPHMFFSFTYIMMFSLVEMGNSKEGI